MMTDAIDVAINFNISNYYSAERYANIARYRIASIDLLRNSLGTNDASVEKTLGDRPEIKLVVNKFGTKKPLSKKRKAKPDSAPERDSSFIMRTPSQEEKLKRSINTYNEYLKTYCNEDIPLEYEFFTMGKMVKTDSEYLVSFDGSYSMDLFDSKIYMNITDECLTVYRISENNMLAQNGEQYVFEENKTFSSKMNYDDGMLRLFFTGDMDVTTEKMELKRSNDDLFVSVDFLSRKKDMVLGRNKFACKISPVACVESENTEEQINEKNSQL